MDSRCQRIVANTSLTITVVQVGGSSKLRATFVNRHASPLWLPQEDEPEYRVDAHGSIVTIRYGLFEREGPNRGDYMIPPMQKIEPRTEHRWEIASPEIQEKVTAPGYRTYLEARVALRPIPQSPVRGEQDIDGYLKDSCVIRSAGVWLQRK